MQVGGGVKYFVELRRATTTFEGSHEGQQKRFELFYLKYMRQHYGMTTQCEVTKMSIYLRVGREKFSQIQLRVMKSLAIAKHFTTSPAIYICGQLH